MDEEELRRRLAQLRVEHRDLDAAIAALTQTGGPDQLQVARLKKRKLALRDLIAQIEGESERKPGRSEAGNLNRVLSHSAQQRSASHADDGFEAERRPHPITDGQARNDGNDVETG